MTFNNLAIEQASAKEANSYETCFVYENMDENKVNLEEIARELFADPLCTTLNKKVGKRKIKSCKSEELRNLATALYNKQYDTQFRVNSCKPVYSPEALGKAVAYRRRLQHLPAYYRYRTQARKTHHRCRWSERRQQTRRESSGFVCSQSGRRRLEPSF